MTSLPSPTPPTVPQGEIDTLIETAQHIISDGDEHSIAATWPTPPVVRELLHRMADALARLRPAEPLTAAQCYTARDHFLALTDQSNWGLMSDGYLKGYADAMEKVHQGVMDFWPELNFDLPERLPAGMRNRVVEVLDQAAAALAYIVPIDIAYDDSWDVAVRFEANANEFIPTAHASIVKARALLADLQAPAGREEKL